MNNHNQQFKYDGTMTKDKIIHHIIKDLNGAKYIYENSIIGLFEYYNVSGLFYEKVKPDLYKMIKQVYNY